MSALQKIRRLLASMDDDALAALANRGLLRRAKKDLENVTPEIVETTDTLVRLQVDDCEIVIPEIPADARSNSPAGAIDRYVLMAFLWLRDQPGDDDFDNDTGDNIGEAETSGLQNDVIAQTPETLDEETLRRWAGKALFQKTLILLGDGLSCVVESERPLTIRVPLRNIVCRWLDGGTLDTMIVTGPGKDAKADGLLAIMAYRIAKGLCERPAAAANAPEAPRGAARTRAEVLESLGAVLREMIALGLTRLSEATQQRLQTLAVSAHGVDLPRLERMIQSLADDVALQRNRNAQASTSKLLAAAARLDALRRALKNRLDHPVSESQTPLADLIGEHRSRYHAVGDIELLGMGARRWTTKSGYVGLTVYFWDKSANNWATWSESRPVGTSGFDPAVAYHADGPWQGCPSPMFASQSIVKLLGAYRNNNGRLSARRATQAIGLEIDDAAVMTPPAVVGDWSTLQERVTRLFGGGLARRREQDEIVFLKPTDWQPAVFDDISQRVVRHVADERGATLPLIAVHDDTRAAETLERYDPVDNMGLLGLVRMSEGSVAIEPVSLFGRRGIRNLTLDAMPPKKRTRTQTVTRAAKDNVFAEDTADENADDFTAEHATDDTSGNGSGRIGELLRLVQSELEAAAESGLGVVRNDESLAAMTQRLNSVGLTVCAAPLERFADERRRVRQSLDANAVFRAAASLLEAHYVLIAITGRTVW